jgi:response regulator RpfG family c-di-GMP phosphodiesterase
MSGWTVWTSLGFAGWLLLAFPLAVGIGRTFRATMAVPSPGANLTAGVPDEGLSVGDSQPRASVLIVDDDPGFRTLLRTTIEQSDLVVIESASAEEAAKMVTRLQPSALVLDVELPGLDGLSFCRRLKNELGAAAPAVVLLTGADVTAAEVRAAGVDATLRKPFSPLDLVGVLDRLIGSSDVGWGRAREPRLREAQAGEQLNLYARDLRDLLALESARRVELEQAYRQTVESLARALEWKDAATGGHALRVQRYALELAGAVDRSLLDDPSVEAGFLLHDVGKIAIPDSILRKRGPLTDSEQELMRQHTLIGSDLLDGIPLLSGEGLGVVRSHHERWDGAGYPDALAGAEIPSAARIFAVADALDAMTSDRPYRKALTWEAAVEEIAEQRGRHFDPEVVDAFGDMTSTLQGICAEFERLAA